MGISTVKQQALGISDHKSMGVSGMCHCFKAKLPYTLDVYRIFLKEMKFKALLFPRKINRLSQNFVIKYEPSWNVSSEKLK